MLTSYIVGSQEISTHSFLNRKKGDSIPMTEIVNFGNTHNVNLEWLLNGKGSEFKNSQGNTEVLYDFTFEDQNKISTMIIQIYY